ncbi:GntR family transcriptional regulator [Robbsia sp. Bb-Pol-6]|uniref:GntR family transcriptional regulator n=1 Tax=Robbsia betulipollinis TaxID=2981849 RepID=A0ABT3ZK03_9BURK|nr:GntR family transcriptional regulator [Robbsia betulipollinis]MCY0386863.1 GntR family transcriptional regulator [Robbsia betulipollinis]
MSQTHSIHARLRESILSLALGPGERLSERMLEARCDGSRTPVRAALLRLETEDLVRREGRNWIVAPIDLGEIDALMEYREPLEAASARLACERAADADLDALTVLLDAGSTHTSQETSHRLGTDFHLELACLAGNAFLSKSIGEVMTRLSRPRWLEIRTDTGREQAWREHRQIVDLIRGRQPDAAARAAAEHVRHTRDRLLQSLREDQRGLRARGFAIVGQTHG